MAEETTIEQFNLSPDPTTAFNESLVILNDYPAKNPQRKMTKYEFYLLVELGHYILLITTIAVGIH